MDTSFINRDIYVCCISYRDGSFLDSIDSLIENASYADRIHMRFFIQDSNHRVPEKNYKNLLINYLKWDDNSGFCKIRYNILKTLPKNSYVLFIKPGTTFKKNWDVDLLNIIKDSSLISHIILDPSSMFFNKNIFEQIGYPNYLKMYGEREDIMIRLYCNKINVLNNLSEFIVTPQEKEYDYIPFSKTHNYNQVELLYKNGYNDYVDLRFNKKYLNYSKKNKILNIFDKINDPEYDCNKLPSLSYKRYIYGKRLNNE